MKIDIAKIIEDKNFKCIFLSPHLDDAVLSCGTLLEQLAGKVDITVVNIFTNAHAKPYTLSAKRFLQLSDSYTDANDLYKERAKEDALLLNNLNIKSVNIGLEDAIFRRKSHKSFLGKFIPEFDHSYPTYRWHVLKGIS